MHAVHANKPMAEIVEAHPELRAAIGCFEFPGIRPEAKVGFNFEHVSATGAVDFPTRESTRHINPIVRSERWMTDSKLTRIARVKASEHDLAHIGAAIAVCILQKENIRRASDKETAAPGHDAVGKREAICKYSALVITPIAVGIFKQSNDAYRRFVWSGPRGITTIFDDKQSPSFIESYCDRISNDWLRGTQFEAQPRLSLEPANSV